jgi:hypothetical protein
VAGTVVPRDVLQAEAEIFDTLELTRLADISGIGAGTIEALNETAELLCRAYPSTPAATLRDRAKRRRHGRRTAGRTRPGSCLRPRLSWSRRRGLRRLPRPRSSGFQRGAGEEIVRPVVRLQPRQVRPDQHPAHRPLPELSEETTGQHLRQPRSRQVTPLRQPVRARCRRHGWPMPGSAGT